MAENTTFVYAPILPDESQDPKLHISDAAVGGLIPTTLAIILFAILRIVKVYQMRKQQRTETEL